MEPFNLEKFKSGQLALTNDNRLCTFVGICDKCCEDSKLLVHIEGNHYVTSYNLDGTYSVQPVGNKPRVKSIHDLTYMISPYRNWDIDTPVQVWNEGRKDDLSIRHFAGIDKNGNPGVWRHGRTSYTSEASDISYYDYTEKLE